MCEISEIGLFNDEEFENDIADVYLDYFLSYVPVTCQLLIKSLVTVLIPIKNVITLLYKKSSFYVLF